MDIDTHNATTPMPTCQAMNACTMLDVSTGPGEPYWANDYCYSWVIEVDPYYCEVGWDAVCIGMYEYCSQGVTSVEDVAMGLIHLYPNPTAGVINFQAPVGAFADVYSASGRVVVSGATSGQIDLRSLPVGLWLL